MRQTETKALATAVGERIRAGREACGKRQEDLAAVARKWGLRWTRATVAAIELGRRQLSVGEFLLLPCVLGFSHIRVKEDEEQFPELFHLLPETGWIAVTPGTQVRAESLREILLGKAGEGGLGNFDTPELRKVRSKEISPEATAARYHYAEAIDKILRHVWPGEKRTLPLLEAAEQDADGDAERKAAQKLGVPPIGVALAARKLWGRSLTEERDRQVAAQTTAETPPRTLQAIRGHVTRALLVQLQPLLAGSGTAEVNKPVYHIKG